jgi:hypothetical protein
MRKDYITESFIICAPHQMPLQLPANNLAGCLGRVMEKNYHVLTLNQ